MAAGGALLAADPLPLPEAWAPFARTAPARREVKFAAFSYRTGKAWAPSKNAYPWAEFISGDKSVLIAGTDSRIAGMRPPAEGVTANGFGHVVLYAGKRELRNPGEDCLGEIRFLVKNGGAWNEAWPCDRLVADKEAGTTTFARPWEAEGTNGVFTYTARAAGAGRVEVAWDVGVDRAAWDERRLDRVFCMFYKPMNGKPTSLSETERRWDVSPEDSVRHITVTMTPIGPQGRIEADFHEATDYQWPPLPKVGGVDFWLSDAYDVPPKPGRDLMTNGGFEQGMKGWRTNRGAPIAAVLNHPGVRFSQIVGEARSGRSALKIDMKGERGDCPAFMSAPLALEPGKRYTASAWIRSDRSRGGGVALVPQPEGEMVKQEWVGGKRPDTACVAGPDWTRISVPFMASEQGTCIQIWPWGGPTWSDDVAVVEGDGADEAVGDPVEARLCSSDECNYFHVGQSRQMRLELYGRAGLSGEVRVSLQNYYHEKIFERPYSFALDAKGFGEVCLRELDAVDLGTGVFVVRLDYAAGACWRDYARFTVMAPHDGTHPVAGFFAHFPWFAGGGAYKYAVSGEYADLVATRMREMGIGATSWQPNSSYATGQWAPYYRKYGIVNKHHILQTDLKARYPERFGWGCPGLAAFTNATPEELSFVEEEAYRSAKEAHPSDVYWTFSNEEELWHPLVKQKKFDVYFKYQCACYRGLKRGFDERGMDFHYAPTHGTSAYCHPSHYDVMDGYLEAAARQGFRYTCVAVHTYHAVDGSILGAGDRDAGAEHLLGRLAHYGYPESTPILFPEGYNVLPMDIPDWGAKDWADVYHGTIPAQSLGLREALHAGVLARIYIIDLKRYPRLKVDHTWLARPYMDDAFTPYMYTMVMNTLGHVLPDPRFIGEARPYPDVRAYCFRPTPDSTDGVLAVWTSANDVEKGLRAGDVLTMPLPDDASFVDLMGNARAPSAKQRTSSGVRVPLTFAPLFIRSGNPQGLLSAVRQATGGKKAEKESGGAVCLPARELGTPEDWSRCAPLPLTNGVSGSVSATARIGWTNDKLVLLVEESGAKSPTLDVLIDGLADARSTGLNGPGPDDCAYRFVGASACRTREANTQFRDGGASGLAPTDAEIERTLAREWKPTAAGGCWRIEFASRHVSPVRIERGAKFGLDLRLTASEGCAALSIDGTPRTYPLIELGQ